MKRMLLCLCRQKESLRLYRINHKSNLMLKKKLHILNLKSEFEIKLTLFFGFIVFAIKVSNKDPPHSFLFALSDKKGDTEMKNDYSRYDFWTVKQNGNTKYYMKVRGKKVLVPKEVFLICQNSYRKMLRESERDRLTHHFSDLTQAEKYRIKQTYTEEKMAYWFENYELNEALDSLTYEERRIIDEIFYQGFSERMVAANLGIPEATLNKRKHKILKKLKAYMIEDKK